MEHESDDVLSERLSEARKKVSVGGFYRHYNGNNYKVIDVALMEGSAQPAVIYQAQYGANLRFIRPLDNWLEEVDRDGQPAKRFTLVA